MYLKESVELLLRVEYHDVEWRTWHELSSPFHFDPVVSGLGRVELAENRSVFLALSLHFHSERA